MSEYKEQMWCLIHLYYTISSNYTASSHTTKGQTVPIGFLISNDIGIDWLIDKYTTEGLIVTLYFHNIAEWFCWSL